MIPTGTAGYLHSYIFFKNLNNPSAQVQNFYGNEEILINGSRINLEVGANGTRGQIHVDEDYIPGNHLDVISKIDFELYDFEANQDFTNNLVTANYNLIHFFGTWCGPCKRDFPALVSLSKHRPDLPIIGIASEYDIDYEELSLLKRKYSLDWVTLVDKNILSSKDNFANGLGITIYPYYLILNQNGEILIKTTRIDDIRMYLNE
jgi:thiol-disulfide isomerase/thioredoxin